MNCKFSIVYAVWKVLPFRRQHTALQSIGNDNTSTPSQVIWARRNPQPSNPWGLASSGGCPSTSVEGRLFCALFRLLYFQIVLPCIPGISHGFFLVSGTTSTSSNVYPPLLQGWSIPVLEMIKSLSRGGFYALVLVLRKYSVGYCCCCTKLFT